MRSINKKLLLLIALILTVLIAFIPNIGYWSEGSYTFYGIPAQWLGYYGDGQFSLEIWGLLLNVLIIYVILFGLLKLFKSKFL
ncbi:putative membrane protein [Metabacillus sp. SLBN-84]